MRNRLWIGWVVAPLLLVAGFWRPPVDGTRYDAARWMESGVEHERAGEGAAAERDLLEAAEVDLLFGPRWTLAGYYFRRGDEDKFWHWTREALAVGQRDLGALFDLCLKLPGGEEKIWTAAMPDRKATWDEYLFYLMSTNRWPAAAKAAARVAEAADEGDKPLLLNYCDLALEHGDRAGAGNVWQLERRRGLVPFLAGTLLTNGDFRTAPNGRCFDWRLKAAAGLVDPFHAGQIGFTLSGYQNEREVLMEQPLALEAATAYVLRFEYKVVPAGVHWEAGAARGETFMAADWARGEFIFSGAASQMALVYERAKGTVLGEGKVELRNVSVEAR